MAQRTWLRGHRLGATARGELARHPGPVAGPGCRAKHSKRAAALSEPARGLCAGRPILRGRHRRGARLFFPTRLTTAQQHQRQHRQPCSHEKPPCSWTDCAPARRRRLESVRRLARHYPWRPSQGLRLRARSSRTTLPRPSPRHRKRLEKALRPSGSSRSAHGTCPTRLPSRRLKSAQRATIAKCRRHPPELRSVA